MDTQSPPPPHPGYYTGAATLPPSQNSDSQEKEDIHEIHEIAKDLQGEKYLNQTANFSEFNRPAYHLDSGGTGTDFNSSKRGFVTIDNITIVDSLKHFEMIELLNMLCRSKELLFGNEELDRKDEKRKRKLIALLINLNWRLSDANLQARLIKSMEERVQMLKRFTQHGSDNSVL